MQEKGDAWHFNADDLVEEAGRLYTHATSYSIEEYRAWLREHPDKAIP
jgi:hypothetical protein